MRCPKCTETEDKVIDSRAIRDGQAIRRRRECTGCGFRFTTYEYIEPEELRVVKRDHRVESYSREKLARSIHLALVKRPVDSETIDAVVERIENALIAKGPDITSLEVGELVMAELKALDEVGYIRFASVYKRFRETDDFKDELKRLEGTE